VRFVIGEGVTNGINQVVGRYTRSSAVTLFLAVRTTQLRFELEMESASAVSKLAAPASGHGRDPVSELSTYTAAELESWLEAVHNFGQRRLYIALPSSLMLERVKENTPKWTSPIKPRQRLVQMLGSSYLMRLRALLP
jgi:hypothetical protein